MHFRKLLPFILLLSMAMYGCGQDPDSTGDDDDVEATPTQQPNTEVDEDQDGYTADEDCADQDATIHPGATELCDGIDNNCNSQTDEGFTNKDYYPDNDGDGYGDETQAISSCNQPEGYIVMGGDCNDADANISPKVIEITCDGIDQNCNGMTDDHPNTDGDAYDICAEDVANSDGYPMDCDDSNRSVYPGATELCDSIDNDCDGQEDEDLPLETYYRDADSDGFGDPNDTIEACGPTGAYVENSGDCDDTDGSINPTAPETPVDGIDSNCNGVSDWLTTVNDPDVPAGYEGDGGPVSDASFNAPHGIVSVDKTGNIYVADTDNHVIRRIDSEGIITTVAGTGEAGFMDGYGTNSPLNSPTALATDGINLYIADTGNNRIRKFAPRDGNLLNTIVGNGTEGFAGDGGFAKDASLNHPMGVEMSPTLTLYVSDTDNNVIRSASFAAAGPSGNPIINTVAGDGFAATAGYAGDNGPATDALLDSPTGLALDTSGTTLYIADTNNQIIRKLEKGTISRVAGTAQIEGFDGDTPAQGLYALLQNPQVVAVDKGKNLYISDTDNNRIRQLTPNGTIFTVAGNGAEEGDVVEDVSTSVDLQGPMGVALDVDGNLMISDTGHSWIRLVTW